MYQVGTILVDQVHHPWQFTIIPEPGLSGFWENSLSKPPFAVTSRSLQPSQKIRPPNKKCSMLLLRRLLHFGNPPTSKRNDVSNDQSWVLWLKRGGLCSSWKKTQIILRHTAAANISSVPVNQPGFSWTVTMVLNTRSAWASKTRKGSFLKST